MRLLALGLSLVVVSACGPRVENEVHVTGLRAIVTSTPSWVARDAPGPRLWAIERAFYEERGYMPAWIDGDRPTEQMKELVRDLHLADTHGLASAKYGVAEFERLHDESQTRVRGTRFSVEGVPELDAKLTYAYLQYAADLLAWGTSPSQVSKHWLTRPKSEDLAARLEAAIASGHIGDSLEGLAPTHPQYKGLQAALMRERGKPDGQVERLAMNLERWRWAPRDLGHRYVLINVPAYMLQVMEGDTPVLAMRVIVGQPDTATPLFSDEMTYVVFSPYWNIPASILRDETLPRVKHDPDFLRRNDMEVVGTSGTVDPSSVDWEDSKATASLRFRQRPGPNNALGLVKFIFPNNFNVYLHDTPGDRLFFREKRTFSHGCIRIEDPVGLAHYVLGDQSEWTDARIRSAMHAGTERTARLTTPLPVHIGYWTAWVEPDGSVRYTDDPYGIDAVHATLHRNKRSSLTR